MKKEKIGFGNLLPESYLKQNRYPWHRSYGISTAMENIQFSLRKLTYCRQPYRQSRIRLPRQV
jgi:hypothetical protein